MITVYFIELDKYGFACVLLLQFLKTDSTIKILFQIAVSFFTIGQIINWDGSWKEWLLVETAIVEMKMIKSTRSTATKTTCHLNVSFVETVLQIQLLQSMCY